jgi:ectoine hydroxylase-related dioxygenase (phytanoyl-CoA dioxygenase family)
MTTITDEQVEQYRAEGWFVLEDVLDAQQLGLLRGGALHVVEKADAAMDAAGVGRLGLNAKGKRYFSSMINELPELRQFLFGATMAEVCRATLGEEAYLFWEQYVIKTADPDSSFSWHQDSGFIHENHAPYLTCWIPLDDVDEENGTVSLLPYSRSGIRSYIRHIRDPRTNDEVCYFGSDPGMPMIAKAGSIVVFSSTVIHRSGANHTDRPRRAYTVQYAKEVIKTADGTAPWGGFEPFLAEGAIVGN